jgi:hypothetical protein
MSKATTTTINTTMAITMVVSHAGNPLAEDVTVMVALSLTVLPLRVALTKSVTVPVPEPARKLTELPLETLSVPRPLPRDQEYVVPAGQLPPVHEGVAVKSWALFVPTVAEGGFT